MRIASSDYVEETAAAVADWLDQEVRNMRHNRADGGEFLAGYEAAINQVLDALLRVKDAIEGIC